MIGLLLLTDSDRSEVTGAAEGLLQDDQNKLKEMERVLKRGW